MYIIHINTCQGAGYFCYNTSMLTSSEIIEKYISFFQSRKHIQIKGDSLVPQNDPTTLFTSSGMQPLVPYLLGETHPFGTRLVDIQNCFRAVDIEEVGDNRHTTFFRMLGNWSLGDYFKKEEIPWLWEFLTKELGLPKDKLYITVFAGNNSIEFDKDSEDIWKKIFAQEKLEPKIFADNTNWWSRSGSPENMPVGEPGGPDTEVYYRFDDMDHGKNCVGDDPTKCECGKFLEIANSVFMQYKKTEDGFVKLPQKNVDFGGGLERLLAAVENQPDIYQTSLHKPIIKVIEHVANSAYQDQQKPMRIIADHFISSVFITSNHVKPANKEQGYILRRLLRRGLDNFYSLNGKDISPILETIVDQYKQTDPYLLDQYEEIKNTILEEEQKYYTTRILARQYIDKKYKSISSGQIKETLHDGEIKEISAEDAFILYTTHGLSPTQIKSLGYHFNDQEFAEKMEAHQVLSRKGAEQKFKGGLADHEEKTIMGHTATHLLHQALRDVLGNQVHQTGSNITTERVRFDFNYDKKLTEEEIKRVEHIVNQKIQENLPVHFEVMPLDDAKKLGAIGLFMDTYGDKVKIYFIGPKSYSSEQTGHSGEPKATPESKVDPGQARMTKPYSIEFCGGPHVDFTGDLKSFKIIKQENLGANMKRIYAVIG